MAHKFVTLACRKWGISKAIMMALLKPLNEARHHSRTTYGDSSKNLREITSRAQDRATQVLLHTGPVSVPQ